MLLIIFTLLDATAKAGTCLDKRAKSYASFIPKTGNTSGTMKRLWKDPTFSSPNIFYLTWNKAEKYFSLCFSRPALSVSLKTRYPSEEIAYIFGIKCLQLQISLPCLQRWTLPRYLQDRMIMFMFFLVPVIRSVCLSLHFQWCWHILQYGGPVCPVPSGLGS